MDIRGISRPSRPQTVAELAAQSENFTFNVNIPLKHWTRAAETLYQEVSWLCPTLILRLNELIGV